MLFVSLREIKYICIIKQQQSNLNLKRGHHKQFTITKYMIGIFIFFCIQRNDYKKLYLRLKNNLIHKNKIQLDYRIPTNLKKKL